MDQTLHRVATKEREEIKGMTKQKTARRLNKEGGNHLEQESNRQRTMEGIDGGLHPAVDGQCLSEGEGEGEGYDQYCVKVWISFRAVGGALGYGKADHYCCCCCSVIYL